MNIRSLLTLLSGSTVSLALLAGAGPAPAAEAAATPTPIVQPSNKAPDVVYVPTPQPVVHRMLELAKVGPGDVLYDLGSGDGRIPVTAAKEYGIRAVGIEINRDRVRDAERNAKGSGVEDKVTFLQGDLFETDLSEASVVTLYLLPSLNLKLRPKLQQLAPGTRIVSHDFNMGNWEPDHTETLGRSTIHVWTVR